MSQSLQLGNPKGRVDVLAVRLVEWWIKARNGVPSDAALSVDLLEAGEMLAGRIGPGAVSAWSALRPHLERAAQECGVSTDQTIPELAHSLGLLKGKRARCKRGAACTV